MSRAIVAGGGFGVLHDLRAPAMPHPTQRRRDARAQRRPAAGLLVAALVAGGCGGARTRGGAHGDLSEFECNDRKVEYMVAGGFGATEAGVRLECDGERPRLTQWRLDDSGERTSKTFALTADQFDATWQKIDSTGWRFLAERCDGGGGDGDPIYAIDVADAGKSVSLSCQGKELPFPYDALVNELDLRAAGFGDDAGAAP